jgi:hypothetical protein
VELYTNDHAPARIVREAVLRAGRRLTPFRRALARTLADEHPAVRPPLQRLRDGLALLRP